ncbi:MAG TPA: hypothetical protein VK633_01330, partial [Verrucomicrobiae bacterium]|nr:hypothetical protein [Verrucomicrobiae bacterium]
TPINWVSAETDIAKGVINLKHLGVESEAFYAESAGPITLADVLTNSTLNFPVDLSLRRSLAEKSGLLSSDTPTNSKFAKLPRFVSIKGTIGAPETDISKTAIFGLVARGAANLGLGNEKTEKALGAVGNILTGSRGGTNAAGTNSTSAADLVQGLGSLLGGKTSTNPPSANAPNDGKANLVRGLSGLLGGQTTAATNAARAKTNGVVTNAVQNLFDSLLRPSNKK